MATIATPVKGVQLAAPPPHLIASVTESINAVVAAIPPGENNAFVAVADLSGMNAAFVKRFDNGWKVEVYVAKTWKGPAEAGARVLKSW